MNGRDTVFSKRVFIKILIEIDFFFLKEKIGIDVCDCGYYPSTI